MDETKLQLLCNHYHDSFSNIQTALKIRGRLLALLLVVTSVMLLQIHSPQQASSAISELITTKLGIKGNLDVSFITCVIWFLLLALVVRYCQVVVQIEREYTYIHNIEEVLTAEFGNGMFTREGKAYSKDYPALTKWAGIVYTVLFPIALVTVVVAKISNERGEWNKLFIFDAAITLAILITIILYLKQLRGWFCGTSIVIAGLILGFSAFSIKQIPENKGLFETQISPVKGALKMPVKKTTIQYEGEEFTIPEGLLDHLKVILDSRWNEEDFSAFIEGGQSPDHICASLIAVRDFIGLTTAYKLPKA